MTDRPIRIGLIGTGRIGRVHAASIAGNPHSELSWVADPYLPGAESVAARFGGVPTDSPDALLASGAIDAVLVASPTPTHVELIEACVDAGLPVLCEKPIDLDIARVDALRDKVLRSGVAVALGFNQRFDPHFADARSRVANGEIGPAEHLSIVSRDPGPPPAEYIAVSGGIFRDMSIHDLDMVRFFLGDIVEVTATGATLFDEGARLHGDYDTVVITLRAASGALATVTNARHSAIGYDQRLEVNGSGGRLLVDNAPSSLVQVSTANLVEGKRPYIEAFVERYAAAYAAELAEFLRLVRGEASTSPTFDDGRAALILADAAQMSAQTGRTISI